MIRFAWLQSRTQTVIAMTGLAIIAVVLAVTGAHLAHLYHTSVASCAASRDCAAADTAFLSNDHALHIGLNVLVIVLPAIIGLFWGAPLVARELEAGTFRLAWTQSVSRARWLAVKLGVVGLAAMAVAGLLSLMVTWWSSPADRLSVSQFGSFDSRDIVPVGYAAFAFALGVTAGVLIRRTLPAMAATLVAFAFARLAMFEWIRPNLIAPVHRGLALSPASTGYGSEGSLLVGSHSSTLQPAPPDIPGAWILSTQIVDKAGHGLTSQFLASTCPDLGDAGPGGGPGGGGPGGGGPGGGGPGGGTGSTSHVPASVQQGLQDCVAKVGRTFHEVVAYQPASRYWPIQWYELAVYLGAAVLLGGICLWWVRRRLT
jgi:hypothetical protein